MSTPEKTNPNLDAKAWWPFPVRAIFCFPAMSFEPLSWMHRETDSMLTRCKSSKNNGRGRDLLARIFTSS
jgi:hypothetical protein